MKKIFLILSLVSADLLHAQDSLLYKILPMKNGKVTYEIIVNVDSTSKNTLYTRAKNWGINQFRSQKDALQVDEREAGTLSYRVFFVNKFTWPTKSLNVRKDDWEYWEVFKMSFKDNKIKIIISDFEIKTKITSAHDHPWTKRGYELDYNIEDFKDALLKPFTGAWPGKKYKDQLIENMVLNFILANTQILGWIESLKKALKENDFDF